MDTDGGNNLCPSVFICGLILRVEVESKLFSGFLGIFVELLGLGERVAFGGVDGEANLDVNFVALRGKRHNKRLPQFVEKFGRHRAGDGYCTQFAGLVVNVGQRR